MTPVALAFGSIWHLMWPEDGRFSNLKVASFDMVARNEVKKDIAHLEIKTFYDNAR